MIYSRTSDSSCTTGNGTLPGTCAPLAFPYIPMQVENPERYSDQKALQVGTLFPDLCLPFKADMTQITDNNTALAELMALDFATDELGLYLDTHPTDEEVVKLYWTYMELSREGRAKYETMYGPIVKTTPTPDIGFVWLENPWPWDEGGKE